MEHATRFAAATFKIAEKDTLVVSFHGPCKTHKFEKSSSGNSDPETSKRQLLVKLLRAFHSKKEKEDNGLIIGGDFNLDIETFAEENQLLLRELGLRFVPVNGGRKKQIDGILCNFGYSKIGEVLSGELRI